MAMPLSFLMCYNRKLNQVEAGSSSTPDWMDSPDRPFALSLEKASCLQRIITGIPPRKSNIIICLIVYFVPSSRRRLPCRRGGKGMRAHAVEDATPTAGELAISARRETPSDSRARPGAAHRGLAPVRRHLRAPIRPGTYGNGLTVSVRGRVSSGVLSRRRSGRNSGGIDEEAAVRAAAGHSTHAPAAAGGAACCAIRAHGLHVATALGGPWSVSEGRGRAKTVPGGLTRFSR